MTEATNIIIATSVTDYSELLEKVTELEARNLKLEQQRDTFVDELARRIDKADQREAEFKAQKGIIEKHLCNMLNEHREIFTNAKEFASYEFAVDYIEACKAVTQLGHEGYGSNDVQEWVNEKYMSDPLNF